VGLSSRSRCRSSVQAHFPTAVREPGPGAVGALAGRPTQKCRDRWSALLLCRVRGTLVRAADCRPESLERPEAAQPNAGSTSCGEARKTAHAWRGHLSCASDASCTANGYRCTSSFFTGPGAAPSAHVTCKRGARRVKFDFRT
jgi:hypothetical protein